MRLKYFKNRTKSLCQKGFLYAIVCLFLGIGVVPLESALVWSPETGWSAEGGTLENLIGTDFDAKNALQLLEKARAAQEKEAYRSALRAYRKLIKQYPLSLLTPEALYQTGLIYKVRKQWRKAFSAFDRLIKRYPDYDKYADALREQYEIITAFKESARRPLFGFIPRIRPYGQAIEYYEILIENAPYGEYATQALMEIAILAREQKDTKRAVDALRLIISDYESSPFVKDAYFMLAESLSDDIQGPAYDQGVTLEAIRYLEDYLTLYPKDSRVDNVEAKLAQLYEVLAKSKFLLGEFYLVNRHEMRAALVLYNETISLAPQSPSAQRARERIQSIENKEPLPVAPGTWLLGPPKPALDKE